MRPARTLFAEHEAGTATFSSDRQYRYTLTRSWGGSRRLVVIGLNPSTADEAKLDPTIRRVIGFARRDGFGAIDMLNLFAWRSTSPDVLNQLGDDAIGPDNDEHIVRVATQLHVGAVVAAWGSHPAARQRGVAVAELLLRHGIALRCWGTTRSGAPRHPLYLSAAAPLLPWRPEVDAIEGAEGGLS